MEDLRRLISILVELHVSTLPPKEKIYNPSALKIKSSPPPPPRIAGKVIKGDGPPSSRPSASKNNHKNFELNDADIRFILMKHNVNPENLLDMLSSNSELRRELGLGDYYLKNSEYYKKIYSVAVRKLWEI